MSEDNKNTAADMVQKLIEKAMTGEHSEFELICDADELKALKLYISGLKKTVESFYALRRALVKEYVKSVPDGGNVDVILALKQFQRCSDFYEKELSIAKDMKDEYKMYIRCGHRIRHLLGLPRPEEDMVDYRTLGWSLF